MMATAHQDYSDCAKIDRSSNHVKHAPPNIVPKALNSFRVRDMNQAEFKSPLIWHLSWGHIEVEGHPTFKDTKVFPGGAREWDWRETGTHHVPGIQPADVQELIEHGAKAVVLSKGMWERLNVCPETLEVLAKSGIEVVGPCRPRLLWSASTSFVESMPVGGLFHSTC